MSTTKLLTIDLNADAGESFGNWTLGHDAALFPLLTSVNLALGFHAGDPVTLHGAVRLAQEHGLGIGAHPGYPDLVGFGRRAMALSPQEIHASVVYQIGALSAFLTLEGAELQHVKAHGALYMRVHENRAAGEAFCEALARLVPQAHLMVLAGAAGEELSRTAAAHGLSVRREAFPERAYTADGRLASRSLPGSSIHDPAEAARRAVQMAQGWVQTLEGERLEMRVDTLCIHGDNPHAVSIAQHIGAALAEEGIRLAPLGKRTPAGQVARPTHHVAALYHRPESEAEQLALPRLAEALLASGLPGLRDVVPAYKSLYVEYDPAQLGAEQLRGWLGQAEVKDADAGRQVEIPVCYDGEDLPEIAERTGLSTAEVARLHAEPTYRVRALGFVAGFPFMETTPGPLQLPRRATPRPAVPPHSLAIANSQTGIYPAAAPGGWNLLGRTLTAVYDPHRTDPFLVRPGDEVRFVAQPGGDPLPAPTPRLLWPAEPGFPALRVRKPGIMGLLMDGGRLGQGRFGLVRSGVLDAQAATIANELLGNAPDSPLLELHLTGPTLEVLGAGAIACTGLGLQAQVNGEPLPPYSSRPVQPGDVISFVPDGQGRVSYLAVSGGFEVSPFLGSASTDVRARLGRPLQAGDVLGYAARPAPQHVARQFVPYWVTQRPALTRLRLLPVAEGETIPDEALDALCAEPFQLVDLDRMAARLAGRAVPGGEITSEAAPIGTVQVPPSGVPLILLNDKGTLGGYSRPARVHPDDLPHLVQLLAGRQIQFVPGQG